MPTQKRSLTSRVCRAVKAFFEPLHKKVLPLSSNNTSVLPTQAVTVTGRVEREGFWPDHLYISSAGTSGGAADWVVNDIRIAGKSQFLQTGDVPGDMFATNAISSFMRFEAARAGASVEIVATYIGINEKGCPLYASITGMEYDPGLIDVAREAISAALARASRGISSRPH